MGELFDHGVDAVNTFMATLLQLGAVSMGYSYYTFILLAGNTATFYFSTWETYYTKVLYLGNPNY